MKPQYHFLLTKFGKYQTEIFFPNIIQPNNIHAWKHENVSKGLNICNYPIKKGWYLMAQCIWLTFMNSIKVTIISKNTILSCHRLFKNFCFMTQGLSIRHKSGSLVLVRLLCNVFRISFSWFRLFYLKNFLLNFVIYKLIALNHDIINLASWKLRIKILHLHLKGLYGKKPFVRNDFDKEMQKLD